jgi:hypothetical protein
MSLLYKIRNFNSDFGQITVQYYSEDNQFNFETAIDLPVNNNMYPVGEELSNLINGLAPTWHYDRTTSIRSGVINASAIENLVEPYENTSESNIENEES